MDTVKIDSDYKIAIFTSCSKFLLWLGEITHMIYDDSMRQRASLLGKAVLICSFLWWGNHIFMRLPHLPVKILAWGTYPPLPPWGGHIGRDKGLMGEGWGMCINHDKIWIFLKLERNVKTVIKYLTKCARRMPNNVKYCLMWGLRILLIGGTGRGSGSWLKLKLKLSQPNQLSWSWIELGWALQKKW